MYESVYAREALESLDRDFRSAVFVNEIAITWFFCCLMFAIGIYVEMGLKFSPVYISFSYLVSVDCAAVHLLLLARFFKLANSYTFCVISRRK